jgi:hypothetical protein
LYAAAAAVHWRIFHWNYLDMLWEPMTKQSDRHGNSVANQKQVSDMPDTTPASNSETPTMRRWRVMEVERLNGDRSRHIFGHDITNDRGRASTAIREFDPETMTATTQRGNHYKLLGIPGSSFALEKVWRSWCTVHDVISEVDVTDEYFDVNRIAVR